MLPPRGHQSAYRLNQRRTERRAFFIQAALGFPLNTPPPRDERSLTVRGPFLFRARFAARLRSRLEQIFCVLLRLSERSRTIEVRVTTLSAQNLRKIFRSMLRDCVYLIDSMPTFNNLVAVICSVLHRTFCAVIRRGRYRISPKRGWARCNRRFIRFKFGSLPFLCGFLQSENKRIESINTRICLQTVRVFSYSLFSVFP